MSPAEGEKSLIPSEHPRRAELDMCAFDRAMANLNDEQRRALHILALSPNGCTEESMLAHGFELATLGDLMFGGFALATPRDTRAGRPSAVIRSIISSESALDTRSYQKGIKVSNAEMKCLDITGDQFHPD
jgi:hypothetical protein